MKRYFFINIIFATLLLMTGCIHEIDEIGLDLQDGNILLGNSFYDSTTIVAYSELYDNIVTSNTANCLLGCVNDPVFGRTKASFYTQFELASGEVEFGQTATLDSICLNLRYNGFFGDTLSPISLQVYELAESLDDSTYTCNSRSLVKTENLTYLNNYTLYPKPTTKIAQDTGYVPSYFSIRLKNSMGQRLLNNSSRLTSTSSFRELLKGLCVTAKSSSNTGNLVYVALTAALSGIEVYYKENGVNKTYTFPVGENCKYYTHFDHYGYNTSSSEFKKQVLNGNHTLGNNVLYAQATGGVRTVIKMPYLDKAFKKGEKVIINKAELVITDIASDNNPFYMPYNLGLQAIGENGKTLQLPDDAIYTSSDYFGGIYDEKKKEYRFRITKYVQQIILGNPTYPNNGMNLVVSGAAIRANRLIFCGPNPDIANLDKRLRLEIYYTTY